VRLRSTLAQHRPSKLGGVDSWIRDIKYAGRSIAGSKSFAAIVVCTIALGTGANTAAFGVLHAFETDVYSVSSRRRLDPARLATSTAPLFITTCSRPASHGSIAVTNSRLMRCDR
jgi:hypothetical protein